MKIKIGNWEANLGEDSISFEGAKIETEDHAVMVAEAILRWAQTQANYRNAEIRQERKDRRAEDRERREALQEKAMAAMLDYADRMFGTEPKSTDREAEEGASRED